MGVNRAHGGVRSNRGVFGLLDDMAEGASVAINGARSTA